MPAFSFVHHSSSLSFSLYELLALDIEGLASQGDWSQAEQRIKQAQALIDPLVHSFPQAFLQQVRGFLAYQREDYATSEDAFRAAARHQLHCPDAPWVFAGPLGLVLINRGKQEEASAYMAELARLLSSFPVNTLATAPIALCMALIAIATNDQERIPDLYTRLLAFQGQHYWFLVDRVLGLLAAQCGEREAALRHLSAARETALREGLRPELARIYLAQANVECTGDDAESVERARDLLKQAQALFQELGMTVSYRRCSQQLHTSMRGYVSPPLTPTELPAHLTEREAAILKLVAGGRSNAQIARELAISEKTVANHLTHIFNKLACKNRAAAAAFAIRNGLA